MNSIFQAKKLINESRNISVFVPKKPTLDALSSAFSLCHIFNKKEKAVSCLPQTRDLPEAYYSFFPQELIPKDFVISIQGKEISELYYEKKNEALKIYLTLKDGKIEKEDIHFSSLRQLSQENFDLLITIGISQLEDLGSFYEKNFKMFWQTPIINIDNHPSNNSFGNINILKQNLPLSVITKNILSIDEDKRFLDKSTRTWLLAGIIEGIQKQTAEAGALIDMLELTSHSIDYQKLITLFFKEKSILNKELLVSVLARLQLEKNNLIAYAFLTQKVFLETKTTPKNLGWVIKYLIKDFIPLPSLLLLWESNAPFSCVRGVFYSKENHLLENFLKNFKGQKSGNAVVFSIKNNSPESNIESILKTL